MGQTIQRRVRIQAGGRILIEASNLPEGVEADVTISLHEEKPVPSYSALFGAGLDGFISSDDADAHLREERDRWEH